MSNAPNVPNIMTTLITEPSICIPRTLHNVNWQQVKDAFETVIGKGTVERVDIVPSKNDDVTPFCRIFVHFRYWPNSPDIMAIRDRLTKGEVIRVVYDNPWFWKCSASRIPRPERNQPKTAPFIEYTGERATKTKNPEDKEAMQSPTPTERSKSPPPVRRMAAHSKLSGSPVIGRQPIFDTSTETEADSDA